MLIHIPTSTEPTGLHACMQQDAEFLDVNQDPRASGEADRQEKQRDRLTGVAGCIKLRR